MSKMPPPPIRRIAPAGPPDSAPLTATEAKEYQSIAEARMEIQAKVMELNADAQHLDARQKRLGLEVLKRLGRPAEFQLRVYGQKMDQVEIVDPTKPQPPAPPAPAGPRAP